MAYLEINKGKALVQSPLKDEPMSIGRLPGNSIVINDPDISRRHCVIERWEGKFSIYDLGSRNGTVVNGQRVQRTELKPGDVITLGGTIAKFLDAPMKPPPRASAARKWLIWAPTLTMFLAAMFIVAWATGMLGRAFAPEDLRDRLGLGATSQPAKEHATSDVNHREPTATPPVPTDAPPAQVDMPPASAPTSNAASPPPDSQQASSEPTLEPASNRSRYQWLDSGSLDKADRLLGRAVAARFVGRPAKDDRGRLIWELPPDGEITALLESSNAAATQVLDAIAADPTLIEAELAGTLQRDRDGTRLVIRVGVIEVQRAWGKSDESLQAATRALIGRRIVIDSRYVAQQ